MDIVKKITQSLNNLNKSIAFLVYGLGISGTASAKYLFSRNVSFYLYDDNQLKVQQLHNQLQEIRKQKKLNSQFFLIKDAEQVTNLKQIKWIVCAPGINPQKSVLIKNLIATSPTIISDLDLSKAHNSCSPFLSITGTNGKSTTTSLTSFLLTNLKHPNNICGNIGISPLSYLIQNPAQSNVFTCQVSSYQASMVKFQFDCGVLLNVTPDHIQRHGTFANYINTKVNIIKNCHYKAINYDDKVLMKFYQLFQTHQSIVQTNQQLPFDQHGLCLFSTVQILPKGFSLLDEVLYLNGCSLGKIETSLIGAHNRQNIIASISLIFLYSQLIHQHIDFSILLKSLCKFNALQHRIEFISQIKGISFYNDSKATNVQSCQVALKCFANVYLLVGGVRKQQGMEYFFDKDYFHHVTMVVCYGKAGKEFYQSLQDYKKFNNSKISLFLQDNLENATYLAFQKALLSLKHVQQKPVILLSPCCASFDQFKNFQDRGTKFKSYVRDIEKQMPQ